MEVCRSLREKYSTLELPIIMVSCRSTKDEIKAALDEGCNDYVTKPFHRTELVARVSTQMNLLRQVRQLRTSIQSELIEVNSYRELVAGYNSELDKLGAGTAVDEKSVETQTDFSPIPSRSAPENTNTQQLQAQQAEIEKLQSQLAAMQVTAQSQAAQLQAKPAAVPAVPFSTVQRTVINEEAEVASNPSQSAPQPVYNGGVPFYSMSSQPAFPSGPIARTSQATPCGYGSIDEEDSEDPSALSVMGSIPQSEQELWGTSRMEQSRHEELQRRILESRIEKHTKDLGKVRESCRELEETTVDYEIKFATVQKDAARLKRKLEETEKMLADRTVELEAADERIQHLFLALSYARGNRGSPTGSPHS
jgi:DNA-binding response OmpR family regulator